jgi:hypothetical protein
MSVIADPARLANLWSRIRAMLERARTEIGAFDPLAALTRARRLTIARWIALIETIVRKVLFVEAAALIVAASAAQKPYNGPQLTIIPLRTFALASHAAPCGPISADAGVGVTESVGVTAPSFVAESRRRPAQFALARCTSPYPLAPSPSRGGGIARCKSTGARRATAFDAAKPETWRVRFALKPPRDPRLCKQRPRIRALWGPYVEPPKPPPRTQRNSTPLALRLAMRFEAVRRVLANPAPHVRRLALLMPRLCRRDRDAPMRYAAETAHPHRSDDIDPRLIIEAMGLALSAAPLFHNSS